MINKLRPYDEFLICSSLFQPSLLDTLFVLDWLFVATRRHMLHTSSYCS